MVSDTRLFSKQMLNLEVSEKNFKLDHHPPLYKKKIQVVEDSSRLRKIDADLQVPNVKKFVKHTGWKPKYIFNKTMTDLLNYWRNQVKIKSFLDR